MNQAQKQVQQRFLDDEKEAIKELEKIYKQALAEINDELAYLMSRQDSDMQHVIYQIEYQQSLKSQIEAILENLHAKEFDTISGYITDSYNTGFAGAMFDMGRQGVPIIVPINQEQVINAVINDTKLSESLYTALGKDTKKLSRQIASEISRGIAQASTYEELARNIENLSKIPKNNAARIARTEAHRVQIQATADAQMEAKKKGADVVKQWDSTMDGNTRPSHRILDGQIRELEESFEVEGRKVMMPGGFNDPSEDCNCRCALLQRAKWALDEDELNVLKKRAEYFELDKAKDFDDFKEKYLKLPPDADTMDIKEASKNVNALDQCKTVEDVEELLKNSGWYYETTDNGTLIRSVDGMSLQGADFECAKIIYRSQEKIFTKYPELIGKLNAMTVTKLDIKIYGECWMGFGHGGVALNSRFFGDVTRLIRCLEKDMKSGYHTNSGAEGMVTHEYGHALDDLLTFTYFAAGTSEKNSSKPKWVSSYLRPKVMKACGMNIDDIGKEVSGYATKDAKEWFAECFAEWVESPNPRPVAKEFGKQLEELMRGIDWNADA